MVLRLATVLLISITAGCSLFTARPVEPPLGTANDPLNFAEILTCNTSTGERFSKLTYNELFNPGYVYETPDGQIQARQAGITRYETIIRKYDSVAVHWKMQDSTRNEFFDRNTIVVLNRVYSTTTVRGGILVVKNGSARIELQYYTVKNTWTIIRFVDSDVNSIFNSLYND